jgi:hypothetical protein
MPAPPQPLSTPQTLFVTPNVCLLVRAEVVSTVPTGADLRLVLDDKRALTGQPLWELKDSPIYATVKEIEVDQGENTIEINYMVLYANNGPYRVGLTGKKVRCSTCQVG